MLHGASSSGVWQHWQLGVLVGEQGFHQTHAHPNPAHLPVQLACKDLLCIGRDKGRHLVGGLGRGVQVAGVSIVVIQRGARGAQGCAGKETLKKQIQQPLYIT
jgi:hypothetical protein